MLMLHNQYDIQQEAHRLCRIAVDDARSEFDAHVRRAYQHLHRGEYALAVEKLDFNAHLASVLARRKARIWERA